MSFAFLFPPRRAVLTAGVAVAAWAGLAAPSAAQSAAPSPTEAELARRLDQLSSELAALKAQLAQLRGQSGAASAGTAGATAAPPSPAAAAAPAWNAGSGASTDVPAVAGATDAGPSTVLGGYAEINYNRPTSAASQTQADLRRVVLGVQHRFDAKTQVVTELEVEHAVTSADDGGEVAIEQAYVERQLAPGWAARAGLFLVPTGLLNENHEPPAYLGVERNFVETAIIPTTWREGGVQLVGTFDNGVTLQTGLSTGFDLSKWDATSTEGRESPLGSIHQEMQFAKAKDLAVFGALNWRGVPGLQLGGSLFSGGASQGQANVPSSRVTLWDLHARWTPGAWDLAALYASGSISGTAAFNRTLIGNASLVPRRFDGWYLQGAYTVWQQGDLALKPFLRWEQFNTARSYADLGDGVTPEAADTERVVTLGTNVSLTPGVVLKADYQRFRLAASNRVNLGVGWSF